MPEVDFEAQYESCPCQCGDEILDLEWDEDSLAFTSECGCMKRHVLRPTKCILEVIEE